MWGVFRGTTPVLVFKLPFDTDCLAEAWITLGQKGVEVINKTLSECIKENNILKVRLTQSDTLKLDSKLSTEIQVRVRTNDGNAYASSVIAARTDRILKDGVI